MDAAIIEAIAEKVHEAWAAEKVRHGFADHVFVACNRPSEKCHEPDRCHVFGRGGCDFPEDKHHPDMLPYADLAENIKDYDRACVRAVLAALKAAGYTLGTTWLTGP